MLFESGFPWKFAKLSKILCKIWKFGKRISEDQIECGCCCCCLFINSTQTPSLECIQTMKGTAKALWVWVEANQTRESTSALSRQVERVITANLCFFVCLRVEFLLKTDSGYPKDTGVTLFTLATPGNPLHYNAYQSAPPVSALIHSRGPRTHSRWRLTAGSQSPVDIFEHKDTYGQAQVCSKGHQQSHVDRPCQPSLVGSSSGMYRIR